MLVLEPGDTIALESGIVLHSIPGRDFYYAFSVVTGEQFHLNRTSFWVLEKINNGIEWINLNSTFLETFEVSAKDGEEDLRQLVSSLEEQNIIRRNRDEKQKDNV
jgi:hypothetical protein